ncbi:hypothetical protein HYDPIDRAFT_110550 [Hydnomerulius pinastri MD-312]|nr:hypothetical protein HYDPIDRAFT_110550 [Hydnomerulius pinastri MD-312]
MALSFAASLPEIIVFLCINSSGSVATSTERSGCPASADFSRPSSSRPPFRQCVGPVLVRSHRITILCILLSQKQQKKIPSLPFMHMMLFFSRFVAARSIPFAYPMGLRHSWARFCWLSFV